MLLKFIHKQPTQLKDLQVETIQNYHDSLGGLLQLDDATQMRLFIRQAIPQVVLQTITAVFEFLPLQGSFWLTHKLESYTKHNILHLDIYSFSMFRLQALLKVIISSQKLTLKAKGADPRERACSLDGLDVLSKGGTEIYRVAS